jgi:outer membrane protein assembly factor BamB
MMRTLLLLVVAGVVVAQTRNAEWVTSGADAQRSYWIPNDPKISVEALLQPGLQQGGFQFLWKSKLGEGLLTPAILMDRYIGYRGFRSFAFAASSSNTIYALDSDLDRIEWQKGLGERATFSPQTSCGSAHPPEIARSISLSYPAFGNTGRVAWAHSDVGASGEGAVTLPAALRAAAAASAPPPPAANPATNPTPPRPGPRPSVIYVLGDGVLHTMNVSNGDAVVPPMLFVPAQSNTQGLTVIDNFAYTVTHECNGKQGGVWALDLATKQAIHWTPGNPSKFPGGDVAGSGGMAFGPDGTIYVTTTEGNLVVLAAKTLDVKDSYSSGGGFTSSPVVFSYKGQNIVAAATGDGIIHLVDAASPGALLFKTAPTAPGASVGALATWQSLNGTRWLLATSSTSVAAWKIVERNNAITLDRGWISRELAFPLPPMIINGVVFVTSNRAPILRALDGATGQPLWDSGKTIAGVASSGLSGGSSQIYLSTSDGAIYAFGFPIEH